jgi:ATP phosphoribosyltransferase
MNVPKPQLEAIIKLLPSITSPTVSPLFGTDWFAVESVIAEAVVRELIPQLLKMGAEGIIEYPLNKVI